MEMSEREMGRNFVIRLTPVLATAALYPNINGCANEAKEKRRPGGE